MLVLNVLQSYYEATRRRARAAVHDPLLPVAEPTARRRTSAPATGRKSASATTSRRVYWLYNRTGEPWLLELAKKIHEPHAGLDQPACTTGTTSTSPRASASRACTICKASDAKFLEAAERNYDTVMDTLRPVPRRRLRRRRELPARVTPIRARASRPAAWSSSCTASRCSPRSPATRAGPTAARSIAFNSLPAAHDAGLKGLHYLTCANQVQLDKATRAPGIQNGGTMFSLQPVRGLPLLPAQRLARLALLRRGALARHRRRRPLRLALCRERSHRQGRRWAQREDPKQTDYPFNEVITIQNLHRQTNPVPALLAHSGLVRRTDGQHQWPRDSCEAGSALIRRHRPPMEKGDPSCCFCPCARRAPVGKEPQRRLRSYGPLSFSLKIAEKWSRYGGTDAWPECEVFPQSPWNYGLGLNEYNPAKSIEIWRKPGPLPANPFTPDGAPIELRVKARKNPGLATRSVRPGGTAPGQPREKRGTGGNRHPHPHGRRPVAHLDVPGYRN